MMIRSCPYNHALLGLSFLALGSTTLLAQSLNNPNTVGQAPIQAQLNTIKFSSRLRLQTATNMQEGRLVLRTTDSIGINGEAGEMRVSRLTVDSAWVRRHHLLPGFLIGTAAGAGAYFLITSTGNLGDMESFNDAVGVGAWVGSALLGTLVGRLIPGWKRVYP